MTAGIRTLTLDPAATLDEILGHRDGRTVRVPPHLVIGQMLRRGDQRLGLSRQGRQRHSDCPALPPRLDAGGVAGDDDGQRA